MEMNNLYRLVFHNNNDNSVSNVMMKDAKGDIRDKFTLAEIDAATTVYDNEQQFQNVLSQIDPNYNNGYFRAEYTYKKEINSLSLAFSNQTAIKNIALSNLNSYTIKGSSYFNVCLSQIYDILKDNPELLKFLRRGEYINSATSNWFSTYFLNLDECNLSEQLDIDDRIKKQLKSYKAFRDIEMGINNYNLMQAGQYVPRYHRTYSLPKAQNQVQPEKGKTKVKKIEPQPPYTGQGMLFNPDDYK
jgi:hypothetical protein